MMIVMVKMRTMKKKTEKTKKKTKTGGGDYKEREREREGMAYSPAQRVAPPPLKRKDDDDDDADDAEGDGDDDDDDDGDGGGDDDADSKMCDSLPSSLHFALFIAPSGSSNIARISLCSSFTSLKHIGSESLGADAAWGLCAGGENSPDTQPTPPVTRPRAPCSRSLPQLATTSNWPVGSRIGPHWYDMV